MCLLSLSAHARQTWDSENTYLVAEQGNIVRMTLPGLTKETVVTAAQLTPQPGGGALRFSNFVLSADKKKLLLFTDSRREYHNTFSSCWVYDIPAAKLTRIGSRLQPGQLLNATLSPNGQYVAYVYDNNIYVEEAATQAVKQLTTDGNDKLLNGWFDYVYSEELFLTNGLRWSPDSKKIAYWQMDLSKVGTFHMINNTDSIYPKLIPFAFSKPGEANAEAKIGVVAVGGGKTQWIQRPEDPQDLYLTQMDWCPDGSRLLLQQMNRKQNESKLFVCHPETGDKQLIYTDRDDAWIDVKLFWMRGGGNYDWVNNGKSFLWASEKSGWRKLYLVDLAGKELLITKGDYDVTALSAIDEKNGFVYFMASPANATQLYLYRASLKGTGMPVRISPAALEGSHRYAFSPDGKWARHSFSSHKYQSASEWVSMPAHKSTDTATAIATHLKENPAAKNISFFKITTDEGVEMDGYMVKPVNFDSTKKYPVVFYVYSEPAGASVTDGAGVGGRGGFFNTDSGYISIAVEGRGAPAPKGRAWRKAIYGNLGWINVNDQAAAAKKITAWPFIDRNRVAVYGSSGGGSTTLHLLFRYPEIYKVGLASAGVPSHFVYNSIYQERYLGVLPESRANYLKGSAITYAKGLTGHLLIMHGTGDHNVHYQGEEMLLNELFKHNRQFQFMPYPNRSHGISEGEGTGVHRRTMMADFLRQYCPPGGL